MESALYAPATAIRLAVALAERAAYRACPGWAALSIHKTRRKRQGLPTAKRQAESASASKREILDQRWAKHIMSSMCQTYRE
jgi:hypothetical protein